ncbi:MAG: disulfide bond formation protein B [Gammaproteobacteria bacterium]|nr:disulfide bond formation protein B [Gammaproteobacteria bacterium]
MITKLIYQMKSLSHSRWYWGLALFTGITLLSVALFYQHVLDHRPCLLCIQVRLWVSLFVFASIGGLLTRFHSQMNSAAHVLIVLIAVGLVDRSYQLLGTERGFVFGDCGFELGLPDWFAIDQWLPSVYYVQTACGYTPELIFGITMAEALMVFSVCLLLLSVCMSVASFLKRSE